LNRAIQKKEAFKKENASANQKSKQQTDKKNA